MSPWTIYPFFVLLILAATFLGRWLGRRVRARDLENADHLPAAQSVLLGLLSLMIAFTLNLSLGRWQARQAAVTHEAAAIEAAIGRATLLPPEDAGPAHILLTRYLKTRIEYGAPGGRPRERTTLEGRSADLRRALWDIAREAMMRDSRSIPVATFVTALDTLDEVHQERIAADRTEVPLAVSVTLYALAIVAFGYLGFVGGAKGARNDVSNAVLAIAFATVITIVDDLDRPDAGLTVVNQSALMDLDHTLDPAPPASPPERALG